MQGPTLESEYDVYRRKILTSKVDRRAVRANAARSLIQRLRRWPNIKTSLFQRVVFAGLHPQNV